MEGPSQESGTAAQPLPHPLQRRSPGPASAASRPLCAHRAAYGAGPADGPAPSSACRALRGPSGHGDAHPAPARHGPGRESQGFVQHISVCEVGLNSCTWSPRPGALVGGGTAGPREGPCHVPAAFPTVEAAVGPGGRGLGHDSLGLPHRCP